MQVARNEKLLKPTARNSERSVQAEQNPNNAQAEQEYGKNCSRNVQAKQNPTARRRHRSTSSSAAAAYMQNRTQLRAGGTGRAHLHPQRTCKTEPNRAQDCGREVHTQTATRAIEWATTRLCVERARLAGRFRVCLDLSCTSCGEEAHFSRHV